MKSKSVRFANSSNELYAYDSHQAPSSITARPTQRFAYPPTQPQPSWQAQPHPSYAGHHSRSLSNTPTIPLPDVHEDSVADGDTPWKIRVHETLRPRHINVDLSTDLHAYILTLSNEPATQPRLQTLILVSKYLPWRTHVLAQGDCVSVRDLMSSLYTAMRTRVTQEELRQAKYVTGVQQAFARRVQGKGHEEARRKGIRRVDFLLQNTRFVGIAETDDPKVWEIRLAPTSHR
ncbi:uncharacterized protein EV420DRAFT_1579533 [Desarmillaria tabescens]|uniref:DUF6699 domain-containing protein n=1 Tax=Armillaria tabescens TaxID=1929756 RepID=A0AA39JFF8_ARMTA|nr:uncharacterized protein EV420DRAFT_1579533 [Desarmillaria tabescens]KAK0441786.1 hypothetical protein EV420DRAFT_1579533 [Desarmillaria tabescens]